MVPHPAPKNVKKTFPRKCSHVNSGLFWCMEGVILPILGEGSRQMADWLAGWLVVGPEKCPTKSSQNGLWMYPELLPHQLRAISTHPNPPNSHIGKNQTNALFLCDFPFYFLIIPSRGHPLGLILEVNGAFLSHTNRPRLRG